MINREIWQKVLPLNNLRKYFNIYLVLVLPLFGQLDQESNYPNPDSFQFAVEQYNHGNYEDADKILQNLSSSERVYFAEEIALLSMRVKYRLNDLNECKNIGKAFIRDFPNSEFQSDILISFGDVFLAEGMYESAFRTFVNVFKINNNEQYRDMVAKRLFLTLQFGIRGQAIDELLNFETEEEIIPLLYLAKTHSNLQNGKVTEASVTLAKIKKKYLSIALLDYYTELKEKVKSTDTNRAIIAVVLPLTGKYTKIGSEFLNGLRHAERNRPLGEGKLSIIVYDNEGEELRTVEILRRLSENTSISAIVGPISTVNSIITSSFAETIGVPIILPNVTKNDLASISNNIYLMNSDLESRGALAAEFIAETLEAENIAVLAPADNYGKNLVDAFEERLELFGKSPIIFEWYSGLPTDLDRQFKSIRDEAWELTYNYVELDSSYVDSTLYNKSPDDDVILNTIDAIYMPIHPGHLNYIGAQFPAYNLKTVVVGNDNWTELDVLKKENIGPHLTNMVAITNYNYHELNELNRNQGENHNKYFYQALDTYNLLAKSVTDAKELGQSLAQIISDISDFKGVFGNYSFRDNANNVNSSLNIIQFDGYKFNDYVESYNIY